MGGLFSKKTKNKTVPHPSCHFPSLVELWQTCTCYKGITDNGLVLGLLSVPGATSSSTCAGSFSPTTTKALWKLSCNCCFFQVWQKAIKSVQKYERCSDISLLGRCLKGTKGTSAASFITKAKGQGIIIAAKGLLEICIEFSQVIYWQTASHKPSWGLKAVWCLAVRGKSYFMFFHGLLPVIFRIPQS